MLKSVPNLQNVGHTRTLKTFREDVRFGIRTRNKSLLTSNPENGTAGINENVVEGVIVAGFDYNASEA